MFMFKSKRVPKLVKHNAVPLVRKKLVKTAQIERRFSRLRTRTTNRIRTYTRPVASLIEANADISCVSYIGRVPRPVLPGSGIESKVQSDIPNRSPRRGHSRDLPVKVNTPPAKRHGHHPSGAPPFGKRDHKEGTHPLRRP